MRTRWLYRVKRGELPTYRKQTYKSPEAYERAFYKFICKQGWYANLKDGVRNPEPNGNGGYWMLGYPYFRAWKSDAYRSFNNAGEHGIRRCLGKIMEERAEREAEECRQARIWKAKYDRLEHTAYITGWPWWTASRSVGLEPSYDRDFPVDLVEAEQFRLGLGSLINEAKKAKKTQTTK